MPWFCFLVEYFLCWDLTDFLSCVVESILVLLFTFCQCVSSFISKYNLMSVKLSYLWHISYIQLEKAGLDWFFSPVQPMSKEKHWNHFKMTGKSDPLETNDKEMRIETIVQYCKWDVLVNWFILIRC